MLALVSFDGLSIACTCLLSLDVISDLMSHSGKALESRTSDSQGYMCDNYH